ncbi:MAG: 6-phosphogluconolactonase [Anaerolineae bacterium]|nr:6-phosphogluconolactonase [Anaerolineae bacterium]
MSDLHISPDAQTLMHDAAARVLACYEAAVARRGVFHFALSGGSTPKTLFGLLASADWSACFDWARVHLWWSDERDVPSDSPDSNYRMAYDSLISKVPVPAENLHRVKTELGAEEAAANYVGEIVMWLRDDSARLDDTEPASYFILHPFDLILLGMGDDGHTASLFPGTSAISERERIVVAQFVPKVYRMRITFTYPLINAARTVMFLTSGASKADMLRRVLMEFHHPEVLPAQGVAPSSGDLIWMVDAPAAAKLTESDGLGEGSLEDIFRRSPKS